MYCDEYEKILMYCNWRIWKDTRMRSRSLAFAFVAPSVVTKKYTNFDEYASLLNTYGYQMDKWCADMSHECEYECIG